LNRKVRKDLAKIAEKSLRPQRLFSAFSAVKGFRSLNRKVRKDLAKIAEKSLRPQRLFSAFSAVKGFKA
jgi:hypothetical protein